MGLELQETALELVVAGGQEEEEVGVAPEEVFVADQDTCGDYLMISLDEEGKMVEEGVEEQGDVKEEEEEEEGQEVFKVYVIKAGAGEDDYGGTVDIAESDAQRDQGVELTESSGRRIREEVVYVSAGDTHHNEEDLGGSKAAEGVCVEVVVGGEEAVPQDSTALSNDFTPVTWPAACGVEAGEGRVRAGSTVRHMAQAGGKSSPAPNQHSKNRKHAEPRHVQTGAAHMQASHAKFKSHGFLKRHTRNNHQEVLNRKKYQCSDCDFSTNRKANLQSHVEAHTPSSREEFRQQRAPSAPRLPAAHAGEKPFPCRSADSSTLQTQAKAPTPAPTPADPRGRRCPHCPHRSSSSSDLKRHVISAHTRDYPHRCPACGKGFHRPSELRKHSAGRCPGPAHNPAPAPASAHSPAPASTHSPTSARQEAAPVPALRSAGGRPLRSEPAHPVRAHQEAGRGGRGRGRGVPGGGAKGPQRGRRVYQCQYCSYSTGDASGFKRHVISIHTKDYPHRCQHCGKGFRRPSEKNQHIARHHRELAASE
ncbi:hypothetical protein MATL_G00021810 [Megalops atlanticus]|uniref:C2H2-type domain-containing protein n=1 Tax=Megalops atlanticus TaxID=7932 RepID=A0A9D3QEW4_MEGAT|nr:hypothetical protein MATL_G00021810 [Megalops atlanticus]